MKDFCKIFAEIEKDPEALVTDWTVRDYYLAKAHILECQACSDSCDRVIEKEKNNPKRNIGFNLN